MRRGLLNDYANTVCHIFCGWRLTVSPGDLPLLLSAGTGELSIDLLNGTASLDGEATTFGMAEELHLWLRERAEADGLEWTAFKQARLMVDFECVERPGEKRKTSVREVAFVCASSIDTTAGSATSSYESREIGVRHKDGPWVIHDV